MGGSDHLGIGVKILKKFKICKNIHINFITTSSNKNIKYLKKIEFLNKNIKLHIDSSNIAKIMQKSDFAIISASVIALEVIFLKIPFIAIKTAENQSELYNYLKFKRYGRVKKFY